MGRGLRGRGRRHRLAGLTVAPCRRHPDRRLELPAAPARRTHAGARPLEGDTHAAICRPAAAPSRPAAQERSPRDHAIPKLLASPQTPLRFAAEAPAPDAAPGQYDLLGGCEAPGSNGLAEPSRKSGAPAATEMSDGEDSTAIDNPTQRRGLATASAVVNRGQGEQTSTCADPVPERDRYCLGFGSDRKGALGALHTHLPTEDDLRGVPPALAAEAEVRSPRPPDRSVRDGGCGPDIEGAGATA